MKYVFTVVFLLLLVVPYRLDPSSFERKFRRLGVEEGLSHNNVYSIVQNSTGFIYIGTQDGMVRYDGHRFKTYYHDPLNENSLSNSNFGKILEDGSGLLWLGTWGGGLDCFDPKTGQFTHYSHDSANPESIAGNFVSVLLEDVGGNIWVGTPMDGLDLFDVRRKIFVHYKHDPTNPESLIDNRVRALARGPGGKIWIGTFGGGVDRYDPNTGIFNHYQSDPDNTHSISHNAISALYFDRRGNLWIGTRGGGLNKLNPKTGHVTRFVINFDNSGELCCLNVNAIFEDSYGFLWIGTYDRGLYRLEPEKGEFIQFANQEKDIFSLSNNRVEVLMEDRSNVLWIGTRGGGVSILDLKPSHFKHWNYPYLNHVEFKNRDTYAITEDNSGDIWFGTDGGGVDKFVEGKSTQNPGFINYRPESSSFPSIDHNRVWALLEDRFGTFWVGTFSGLKIFDKKNATFHELPPMEISNGLTGAKSSEGEELRILNSAIITKLYQDNDGSIWVGTSKGLFHLTYADKTYSGRYYWVNLKNSDNQQVSQNYIDAILRDSRGELWVGGDGGLHVMKPDSEKGRVTFKPFRGEPGKGHGLSHHNVTVLHEDYNQHIWIGTFGGLNMLDPKTEKFTCFTREDGLPNNVILGILEDDLHYLWISTSYGLSRLDLKKKTFKNYDIHDGLLGNGFNSRSYFKSDTGEMFFGCSGGVISFTPGRREENLHVPPIVFTNLTFWGDKSGLGYQQLSKGEIEFPSKRNGFYFEFAALDFTDPEKNSYSYKLEGFDENWNNSGNRRFGLYTNLPPGDYILKIKGANNDGVWNQKGASLKIHIQPSFWQTLWFKLLLLVLVFITVLQAYRWRVRNIRRQQRKLEELVGKRTAQLEVANRLAQQQRAAAEAASNSKSEFLARMSHEIRTPLNSILGFNEILLETKLDPQQEDYVRTVMRSGEILLTLINEVLDFSKIESGQLVLDYEDFDVRSVAYDVCHLVSPRLGDQPVEILCYVDDTVPDIVHGDSGKFRQVLTNLLGNAVKFTREGEIQLSVKAKEEGEKIEFQVEVRDTGIGVDKSQQQSIFEVFQQADGSTNRKYGGSGLGLAISRRIARLMKGDIWIESEKGKGSTFFFTAIMRKSTDKNPFQKRESFQNKKVLLVDDNLNSLNIIAGQLEMAGIDVTPLSDSRKVLETLEKANHDRNPFHLCIVDGRMPYMDGHEIASLIHNAAPMIAALPLLALSPSEKKNYLFARSGFNGCLPKPVHPEKLLDMLDQLLQVEQKRKKNIPIVIEKEEQKEEDYNVDTNEYELNEELLLENKTSSIQILVAEDHQINRKLIHHILGKEGYGQNFAENGKEAFDMYTQNPDYYDLILMDIQMPEMNGTEATKAIRQWEKEHFNDSRAGIPIIALTAQVIRGEQDKCYEVGMNDFIAKPLKRELLLEIIEKWAFRE